MAKPRRNPLINKPSSGSQNTMALGRMRGALRGSVRAQRIESYLDSALGTSSSPAPAPKYKRPSR